MQTPYVPGENNRLDWKDGLPLEEAGDASPAPGSAAGTGTSTGTAAPPPVLVLAYGSDMAKDCCAANFERTVFRTKAVVDVARSFECVKVAYGTAAAGALGAFELKPEKPAILLLDGERTLIHKQQSCIDPQKYFPIIREALSVHEKRMKGRDAFAAKLADARAKLEAEDCAKALKAVDGVLRKRAELTGRLLAEAARIKAALIAKGGAWMSEAMALRVEGKLEEALRLLERVGRDFATVPELYKEATKAAIEVQAELEGKRS